MSALHRLIVAVWAAVWVRGRLFVARARRVLGARPPAIGSGYYLSAAEIPVEGVDYELADLPPELAARLAAARGELVEHARGATTRQRRRRRVRRRRTASLAMAALLTLAVLGAGATALVTGTTGVPAVDRLLGIYEKNLDKPGATERLGPTGGDRRPDPSIEGTSVEAPTPDGRVVVAAAYVANDGNICTALTNVQGRPSGNLGCVSPASLVDSLEQRGGVSVSSVGVSTGAVLTGFVRSDVSRVEGSGPSGELDVYVGDTWAGGPAEIGPVKYYVAVVTGRPDRPVNARDYSLRAVTSEGDRLQIVP